MTITMRVTSIAESGADRVIVNLVSLEDAALNNLVGHHLTLNLSKTDAGSYFPGDTYELALTESTPA